VRYLHPSDVAPAGPVHLPATGLSRGWEPAALAILTFLLLAVGLVSVYSASSFLAQRQQLPDYHYIVRQAAGAGVGLLLFFAASRVPYRFWHAAAWPLLMFAWVLLILVILPWTQAIAPQVNGARRWLDVGVTFQPSELAKFALVVWTAMLAVRKQDHLRSFWRGMLPFVLVGLALAIPVLKEPDLSTAFVLLLLSGVVLFAAGGRIGHFLLLGVLAVPLLWSQLGVGFREERMLSFLNAAADPDGAGFQVRQSLIALGSGGITGQGFGEGRQKFGFLPEPHNDFIFAMIGEEWGLVGVLVLIGLYVGLILVGFRVARRAPDLFGQLLAVGLTSMVAVQALLHMAVGLGMVPPTGLALPLISFGRSNLLVTLLSLGVLASVARTTEEVWSRGA